MIVGLAISGWQASPYFWHKTDFLVVVFGIPILVVCPHHRMACRQDSR